MGIPSYFAHIVRTHRAIIKKLPLSPDSAKINNLYLDCNSFIYEAHHHLRTTFNASNNTDKNSSVYEKSIIKYVCDSLTKMIKHLNPTNRILIAFDGVAPMAKLNQQRNRRYMSAFQNSLLENSVNEWNTASITPGTDFMKRLGEEITKRFLHPAEFGLETIIVSTSEEAGEGEHKNNYLWIRCRSYYADIKSLTYI
jgi:5'-3' exonuclease